MILSGLHPNTTPEHLATAKAYLTSSLPVGSYRKKFEKQLKQFSGVKDAYALDSGRSALYIALLSLELPKGSFVGVCAYTCIVVRNAIIAAGYKPKYIDVDESLCISPNYLPTKGEIKALITQHTFGTKHKNYANILAWAKKQNIPVIEDCAHIFKEITSTADMRIHSFGPEKPLSAIRGGILLVLNDTYHQRVNTNVQTLSDQPKKITKRLMRTQLLFSIWRRHFPGFFTKLHITVFKKMKWTIPILQENEVKGIQPTWLPTLMGEPNALISLQELQAIKKRNTHREKIFTEYKKILPSRAFLQSDHDIDIPLEIVIQVNSSPKDVLQKLQQKDIYLSPSWLYTPIVPASSYKHLPKQEQSELKTCKNAERYSAGIITIPTHYSITQDQATRIATALLPYV